MGEKYSFFNMFRPTLLMGLIELDFSIIHWVFKKKLSGLNIKKTCPGECPSINGVDCEDSKMCGAAHLSQAVKCWSEKEKQQDILYNYEPASKNGRCAWCAP